MVRIHALFLSVLLPAAASTNTTQAPPQAAQPVQSITIDDRAALHRSNDWQVVVSHLPDPATATPERLEMAGDILRARRFPDDAIDYYQFALNRGGDPRGLQKKIGVTRLELGQLAEARAIFLRCVHTWKKDAQGWNNLGAADYALGSYSNAINEYRRAVKLDRQSAIFHSNLGMAYFSIRDAESARAQFGIALRLDPSLLSDRNSGGVTLRVLQSEDYGQLCLMMAKMYTEQNDATAARLWLQKAAEHGTSLRSALNDDAVLRLWLKDPEVLVMIHNAEQMHKRLASATVPSLGTGVPATLPN